jgi:peptide/nickel transport system substrate-binding protein
MEIVGIPDGQARLQALLGGQIDMEPGITRQQRVLLDRSGRHTVQEVPTGNWRGIVFRTDVRPFDDVRVRRAIRMAVDRKALLDLVAGGAGAIGCDTPVGPTDQYRAPHDAARECPQNIEGARRLLAEAGFPNGIDFDLQVATLEPVWPTLAEAFQQQVAGAGIRVRINQVPSDGYWSQVWMRRDAVMTRWNQRPADATLNEIFRTGSAWNESHFKDPRFDAILDAARRELDFDKRKALYIDAQNHLRDNSGTLVAFHATVFVGTTNRVRDLDPVEYFSIRWNRVKVN